MRREVAHWLRVRELGDVEMKELVEKHMISVAHEVLGDYRKKILLSLPRQSVARGKFSLGTVVYEKEKWPIGISEKELLQNLAIFGRSGAGKTNVAFHILRQLEAHKIPFLFLDWKRTARHLIPLFKRRVNLYTPGRSLSPFSFNPFAAPSGMENHVYINQLVDVMADAYTLGDGARSLVQKALARCYERGNSTPAVKQVVEELEKIPVKERERGWKISALRALETLAYARLTAEGGSQEEMVRTLLDSSTVVELDGLDQGSKEFLIPLLCLWIFHSRLAETDRERLKLVVFIEEAHHILYGERKKESLMEQLLRQCRELGIAFVVVDQHPHLISSAALGNTYTTICLNLKDPKDLSRAAGLSLLEDREKEYLSLLPVGQGIVKLQDRWRRPFLVRFPLVGIDKGSVTDEVLRRYLKDRRALSGLRASPVGAANGFGRIRFGDRGLEVEAFGLLQDVLEHPDDGVDARYRRLGFSGDKGNRLKEQLLEVAIVEGQLVRVGNTRKLLLRVTDGARRELGIASVDAGGPARRRESLAHEYWKRYYARRFADQGYSVEVEAPRRKGRMDVLAVKGPENGTRASETVAIEIETGKSDVVENVRQDLLSGFSKVLVVATDEKALRVVEKELAQPGLQATARVRVVIAGDV